MGDWETEETDLGDRGDLHMEMMGDRGDRRATDGRQTGDRRCDICRPGQSFTVMTAKDRGDREDRHPSACDFNVYDNATQL